MSGLSPTALGVKYKNQVLSRLVAAYTEEFLKLLSDADYKALLPTDQITAQFELTHWYQRWFNLIPDPTKNSVDLDEYTEIPSITPHAVASMSGGIISFFSDFIPLSHVPRNVSDYQSSFFRPDYVDLTKTKHPEMM